MTDKVGLLPVGCPEQEEKINKAPSSKSLDDKPKPSSSNTEDDAATNANKCASTKEKNEAKIQKNRTQKNDKDSDPSPYSVPNLYHKFVTSFDAVLQTLVTEEESVKQILPSLDIEGIASYIKEEQPRNVIFMVGAGISTSAGIPDFRTPGTGLYDNLSKFNLPNPQAVFDIDFFKENPEPFFILARELFHENINPTPCHHFIRLFEEKGMLRRCFTQNIDTLEYAAGISEDRIVTAHGSHQNSTCQKSSCKKKYSKEWFAKSLQDKEKIVPRCESCNSVVKPDIVFFGEKLSNRFFSAALADFPKCDLLIIMGTSLVVQPFASLVQQVPKDVPRLLINLTSAGQEGDTSNGNLGEGDHLRYGQEGNIRDVFWKGTCDDGSYKLAKLLGWEDELKHLCKRK